MREKYRQLIGDTKNYLLENFRSGDVLLTSHSFPPPIHPPAAPSPQTAPAERKPIPLPSSPKKTQNSVFDHFNALHEDHRNKPSQNFIPKNSLKETIQQIAPHIRLLEDLPCDAEAKMLASEWKEQEFIHEITLLSFTDNEKERLFLNHLTIAINSCLKPARMIDGRRLEKENKWNLLLDNSKLRYVIAPPVVFSSFPSLMTFYKELPATEERLLGDKPLFLLSPITSYFQNPSLKISLWQTLSTLLSL